MIMQTNLRKNVCSAKSHLKFCRVTRKKNEKKLTFPGQRPDFGRQKWDFVAQKRRFKNPKRRFCLTVFGNV